MKKIAKISTIALACCVGLGALAGCGDPLKKGKTVVTLWGYADEEEADTVRSIAQWYNENNQDEIYKIGRAHV